MRILAVDPGDRRIGLAISDPTESVARALIVIEHTSRALDAAVIADLARQHEAGRILVGVAGLSADPGPQARKCARLADAIRQQTDLPVELWDESFTTLDAAAARRSAGGSGRRARSDLDAAAAAALLQSYLDVNASAIFPTAP